MKLKYISLLEKGIHLRHLKNTKYFSKTVFSLDFLLLGVKRELKNLNRTKEVFNNQSETFIQNDVIQSLSVKTRKYHPIARKLIFSNRILEMRFSRKQRKTGKKWFFDKKSLSYDLIDFIPLAFAQNTINILQKYLIYCRLRMVKCDYYAVLHQRQ